MDVSLSWLLLAVMLFIVELLSLSFFLLFFAVGAFVVGLLTIMMPLVYETQIILFLGVSIVTLLLFRAPIKAWLNTRERRHKPTDNIEDVLGREATVTQRIEPSKHGEVDLAGTRWKASAQVPIQEGTSVRVIDRANLLLIVEPI